MLFILACLEDLDKAKEIATQSPDIIHEKTTLHETPLHYLAVEGHLKAVQMLQSMGAEVNTVGDFGWTPLSQAVSLGYFDMAAYLLQNGARIEGEFGLGNTIIHEAVRGGDPAILELLVDHGANLFGKNGIGHSSLHSAAQDDDYLAVTSYLINQGLDLDERGTFAETPLIEACLHGSAKNAMLLVAAGADITLKDAKGRTAEETAGQHEHYSLAQWLREQQCLPVYH